MSGLDFSRTAVRHHWVRKFLVTAVSVLLVCPLLSARSRWGPLLLMLAVAVLAAGCAASQTLTPAPTVTPLPFYATAAADPGWHALQQRPLHLPTLAAGAACPTTPGHLVRADLGIGLGTGPVYPILGEATSNPQQAQTLQTQAILQYRPTGSYGWGGMKVLWVIDSAYHGFVLIRGRQIDGRHALGFNGGIDQPGTYTAEPPPIVALRLVAPGPGAAGQWANWPSQTRLQAPGCYAYQVDGGSFSAVIVFRAVPVAQ